MTNTTYFPNVVREASSTTTSSSCSSSSSQQELPSEGQPSSSSSKLYKVIGKALISLVSRRRGSNSKDSGNNEKSSGNFSPSSLLPGPSGENGNLESGNLMSFSFKELGTATRNFSSDFVLGEGGFGKVFKGWVDTNTQNASKPGSGIAMAIKILNNEGFQGHKEWLAEVNYLGRLNHPNLVRLCGYCSENENRLLLYEFMPRGSLENHLFRRRYSSELSWSIRMKITLGAAKGLAFLHRADINVIHRGFKSSNILLDLNYNAKLSDFGFARDGPNDDRSHVTTVVMGTLGYAAPEYIATGHLSAKSDVYTFGVVLLELLTGRRSFEHNRPSKEQNLVEWVRPHLRNKRKIFLFLDTQLMGQCSRGSVQKAANLAFKCLANDAKLRPNMDEVVATVEQLQDS